MAGKQTFDKVRTNKAYAEGRTARFKGKSASDNPWPAAFEEETAAWASGYAASDGDLDDTCYSGVTGLPDATGVNMPEPVPEPEPEPEHNAIPLKRSSLKRHKAG